LLGGEFNQARSPVLPAQDDADQPPVLVVEDVAVAATGDAA
jgi:hypothetical protein